jgi:hypothetical protein
MPEIKLRSHSYGPTRKSHYRPRLKPKSKAKSAPPVPLSSPEPRWDGLYVGPRGRSVYFFRGDANALCQDCSCSYGEHPKDRRERDMTVLCCGWRVKLPPKNPAA